MLEPSPNTSAHFGSNNHDVHVATTGSNPKHSRAKPRARPNDSSTPAGSNPPDGICNRNDGSPTPNPAPNPAAASAPHHPTPAPHTNPPGPNRKPPPHNHPPTNPPPTHPP